MDAAADHRSPSFMTLKELVPLQPWKTPPPPFSQSRCGKYTKVKDPIPKDGARVVFWAPKTRQRDADDDDIDVEIPYQGLFEFIDKFVISKVRLWIDRLLGEILCLPKYDAYHYRSR
ncbi:unnamed protein product [Prunus armeniaca]|uniref:Uncharacterized protein n=1 Tax=Prunus armeniaca TaxID=36596 RepID=A0A6J5W891_PRUAR|nr:unnamed protein product [Prunus armeniaca]